MIRMAGRITPVTTFRDWSPENVNANVPTVKVVITAVMDDRKVSNFAILSYWF
jgi:hypothetical protein